MSFNNHTSQSAKVEIILCSLAEYLLSYVRSGRELTDIIFFSRSSQVIPKIKKLFIQRQYSSFMRNKLYSSQHLYSLVVGCMVISVNIKMDLGVSGGTGFLGKVLIEKLLRCCSEITRIYILVRRKKDKSIQERVNNLLKDSFFDGIRDKDLDKKLVGIAGDCTENKLGLSDDDIHLLKDEVSIVFHVAATIKFNEKLKQAVYTNILSTSCILDLCKGMKHLKSVVHVSTVYANSSAPIVKEKFYEYSIKPQEVFHLVNVLSEDTVNVITPMLLSHWPNTYTFTKALAEDLVRTDSQNLPIGIFRPGIVISTANEPKPGWTDNFNGPTSVVFGAASGIIRTWYISGTLVNIVPVDLTVNALIASAWDISIQNNRRGEHTLIYNFSSTTEAPISWLKYAEITQKFFREYPTKTAMWYYMLNITKYKFMHNLYSFFLHSIPGTLLDCAARIIGRTPRLQKTYRKISDLADLLNYFCTNDWEFENNNVQSMWRRLDSRDQQLFQFTMVNFDWLKYLENYVKGIRLFLFKDDLSTLKSCRFKHKWFLIIYELIVVSLYFLVFWIMWKIFSEILS